MTLLRQNWRLWDHFIIEDVTCKLVAFWFDHKTNAVIGTYKMFRSNKDVLLHQLPSVDIPLVTRDLLYDMFIYDIDRRVI